MTLSDLVLKEFGDEEKTRFEMRPISDHLDLLTKLLINKG